MKRFVLSDCIIINDQLAFVKSCTVVGVVGDSDDDVLGVCANGQTELGARHLSVFSVLQGQYLSQPSP